MAWSCRGGSALTHLDLGSALNLCSELPGVRLGGGRCWRRTQGSASSSESGGGLLRLRGDAAPVPSSDTN